MKNIYTLLVILFIINNLALAQVRDIKNLHHEKRHTVASNLIDNGSYFNAIEQLTALANEHPKNRKYANRLAEAFFFSRDYASAEVWFKKVVELDAKVTTAALFRLAETQKYNRKYSEAKANFKLFLDSKFKDYRGTKFRLYAEQEIISCEFAEKNYKFIDSTTIEHLGDSINSAYSDFSPTLINDSTLIFASLQSDTVLTYSHEEVHAYQTKLYEAKLKENGWATPELIEKVNTAFESNANGSLSPDGKKFYFSRCYENLKHQTICYLYVADVDKDGNLGKPKKLHSGINRHGFSNTQPHITVHKTDKGEQQILYFSSNRIGGKGGFDIWFSTIAPDGSLRNPLNAGKDINSVRDEITPYYDRLTGKLYFSSNFYPGFGGFDIFSSKGQMTAWDTVPHNVGQPLNSSVDDTYFNYGKGNAGFLVSNREGGINLKSKTCCDDIYSFTKPAPTLLLVHTYKKRDKSIYPNAFETINELKVGKEPTSIKPYKNIDNELMTKMLLENQMYIMDSSQTYSAQSHTNEKLLERVLFKTNAKDIPGELSLLNPQDSASITKVDHPRLSIWSLNIYIYEEDTTKKAIVQSPDTTIKLKSTLTQVVDTTLNKVKITQVAQQVDTLNKIKLKQVNEQVQVDTLKKVKNARQTNMAALIDTVFKTIDEVEKNDKTVAKVDTTNKTKLSNTQQKAITINKLTDLRAQQVEDSIRRLKLQNTLAQAIEDTVKMHKKVERKVTKVYRFKDVKRCIVYDDKTSEALDVSSSSRIDSIISSIETRNIPKSKAKIEDEPDIQMTVHYGYNEDDFIQEHRTMLDSIARFLVHHPRVKLKIEAHTDNVGSEQYNLDLSYKRAKTLMKFFTHMGIPKEQITPVWHGEAKPAKPNNASDGTPIPEHHKVNRRAELKFYNYKK